MNYSKAIFLINNDVRAIKVSYEPAEDRGRKPTYPEADAKNCRVFKAFDPLMKEGDLVIVPTKTRHGMTVCKVEEVDVDPEVESSGEMEWIVGRVDPRQYKQTLANEADAIAKIRKANERQKRAKLAQALLADAKAEEEITSLPLYNIEGTED